MVHKIRWWIIAGREMKILPHWSNSWDGGIATLNQLSMSELMLFLHRSYSQYLSRHAQRGKILFCETYAVDKWVLSVIYYSRLVLYTLVWGMMHSCEQAVDEEVPNLILINFACQCKHASGKWIIITSLIARAVSGQIAYRLAKMGRLLAFMNKLP